MRPSKKFYSITATAVTAAALTAGLAGAASAVSHRPSYGNGGTHNCAHGIWAGYCGTQESGTGLYIAVSPWDRQIIGTKHPRPDNGEFVWFHDSTSASNPSQNYKYAVFAPNGIPTNEVIAEVNGQVVLAGATGATNQKWHYDGTGWTNVATGHVLKSTTNNGAILAVTGPSSGASQTWTFVIP